MRFNSSCHGNNIILSEDGTQASRSKSYYHGITFSEKPQRPGQLMTFQLLEENKSWSGTIRYGLSNSNPEDLEPLPPFSIPDLASKPGIWAKPLSEHHQNVGSQIGFSFTNDGSLSLYVDEECKETYDLNGAVDVTEPVWAVIDVYGSITSVRLISSDADNLPVDIIARGIKAQEAYREAASIGCKKVYHTRLMLVGQEQVGKTSLMKLLMGESFIADEERTCGIETHNVCEIDETDGWKICGRDYESESKIRDEYIKAISDIIVKTLSEASVTDEDTIGSNTDEGTSEHPTSSMDSEMMDRLMQTSANLIGSNTSDCATESNLTHLPDEIVDQVERRLRKQRQKTKNHPKEEKQVTLTTENEDDNIVMRIWDFAGQNLHTSHQVFFSNQAVYIVVFDLRHDLNKASSTDTQEKNTDVSASIDCLDLWLRSIYTYTTPLTPSGQQMKPLSPPIFIVGTYKDSLDPDPKKRQKLVDNKFAAIRAHLMNKPYRQHVVYPFYAIENDMKDLKDQSLIALRKHIETVLKDEPYMGKEIPIRWLLFESALKKSVDKGIHFMTLEQIKELTHSLGMDSFKDLFTMLQFYHDLGHIIYFGGENGSNETLKDLVILDPKWLTDIFNQFFTVKDISQQDTCGYTPSDVMNAWTCLDNEGILEECLISHTWNHIIEHKPVLLELMTKFDLLCPITKSNDGNLPSYYVPSCMHLGHGLPASHNSSAEVFYIDFDGFLPDGIFHQLIAHAVRWSQDQGGSIPSLRHRYASLYADDLHQMELQMSPTQQTQIMVVITRDTVVMTTRDNEDANDSDENSKPTPQMCNKVKIFLSNTLEKLKMAWPKPVSYSFCIDCPCMCGEPHMVDLDRCFIKDIIMCAARKKIDTKGIKTRFQGMPDSTTASIPSAPDRTHSSSTASHKSTSSVTSVGSENMLATVLDSDVQLGRKLGQGGFGWVFLATHKHWGNVAVKQMRSQGSIAPEARKMWMTISSPFLVTIMGIIDDPHNPSIVMEYFKHGCLKHCLDFMVRSEVMPTKVRMILDITLGMNFLHNLSSPIVHRDLKCENVFVTDGFTAKIGDLGLAKSMETMYSQDKAEAAGTLSHLPPEALEGIIDKPTTYWDVYTFGITLYEIFTNGKDPWPQTKSFAGVEILLLWLKRGDRPTLDAIPDGSVPSDLIDIMKRCWDGDPMKRPTFQDLQKELSNMYSTQYEDDIEKSVIVINEVIQIKKKEKLECPEKLDSSTDAFWEGSAHP